MTPLDDELRSTLSARAAALDPSPDPLAGIESRAGRIRRRRVAASGAGAALAVAAVAVAVPAVLPSSGSGTPQLAASGEPSPGETQPASPTTWGYRGNDLPAAALDAFRTAWGKRHPSSALVRVPMVLIRAVSS